MRLGSTDTLEVQVSINGDLIPGVLRASIATTNCYSADTYSLTFAMDVSDDIGFWSTVSSACLNVTAVVSSALGPSFYNLITGMVDTVHVDPIRRTVGVEGRDLSSSLVDSYRQPLLSG
jgi:hypothetical protein